MSLTAMGIRVEIKDHCTFVLLDLLITILRTAMGHGGRVQVLHFQFRNNAMRGSIFAQSQFQQLLETIPQIVDNIIRHFKRNEMATIILL